MKRIWILVLSVWMLTCSGCIRSVQLNERAIVQAVGLDKEEDGYALTLQLFDPEAGEETATSGGKILHVKGKTISEAMRNANLQQGQEIFYGHTKLILFGDTIAREGIAAAVDTFNSNPQFRPGMDMLVTDGKASQVLAKPLDQTILPVLSTKMMLEGYRDNGKVIRSQLRGVAASLENQATGSYLPIAAASADEQNPGIQIIGTAILQDGKTVGALSPEETRGLLWAAGEMGKTQLTLEQEAFGAVTLEVVWSSVSVTATIQNGAPFYQVQIRVESNVSEEILSQEEMSMTKRYDRYEQEQGELIRQETEQVLQRLFHEFSCDALGYANVLIQQQPAYWKEQQDRYVQQLDSVGFSVEVDSRVNRAGTALS